MAVEAGRLTYGTLGFFEKLNTFLDCLGIVDLEVDLQLVLIVVLELLDYAIVVADHEWLDMGLIDFQKPVHETTLGPRG